jgi:hypothetical protein
VVVAMGKSGGCGWCMRSPKRTKNGSGDRPAAGDLLSLQLAFFYLDWARRQVCADFLVAFPAGLFCLVWRSIGYEGGHVA